MSDEFAGVLGRAHHPNGGGRLGKRIVVCSGAAAHRLRRAGTPCRSRFLNLLGVAVTHQRQVDVVEREVAAEGVQTQPGVAVDVAFADLHEPSTDGQQFEPGALRGTGQGVEHDVDAVPVGVAADQVGELGAPRVVDVLDAHVVQQRTPLRAARRREDLRSCQASYRYRGLPHAAGRGVDQHPLTGLDPGQVVQAVPGGGVRGRHRGRLVGVSDRAAG